MEKLAIRQISGKDLKPALALVRSAAKGWGKSWLRFMLSSYREAAARCSCGKVFGVFIGKELAATFVLRHEVDALVIFFISVKKERQHTGIGTSIVKFAEKFGKGTGARIVRVDVAAELGGAGFYEKLGFRKCGSARNFYLGGDEQVFLWKKL